MAEHDHESVEAHPIAPRMRNGPKKPHVGPTRDDYHQHHAMTVGHHSDKWWAKVSIATSVFFARVDRALSRSRGRFDSLLPVASPSELRLLLCDNIDSRWRGARS